MWIRFFLVVVCCVCVSGCRQAPDIADSYDPIDSRYHSSVKAGVADYAPIVLVGKVLSIRPVGRPTRAARSPGVELQLTELNVIVENVLRGPVTGSVATFYMYLLSQVGGEEFPRGFKYYPQLGERRAYFLKRDNGVLRSIGDVMESYTIPIFSGSHEHSRMPPGISVRRAISVMLLSEGVEVPCEFAENLQNSYEIAAQLTSREYAITLVRDLAATHHGIVELVARNIMVEEGYRDAQGAPLGAKPRVEPRRLPAPVRRSAR